MNLSCLTTVDEYCDTYVWKTIAVVTPITLSIGMAFRRREEALLYIARLKSFTFQIYLAHAIWDWDGGKGKAGLCHYNNEVTPWVEHSDLVYEQLIGLGHELSRFLSLPTCSRSYHRVLKSGQRDAAEIMEVQKSLFDSLYTRRMTRLTKLTEEMKALGLSANEASRIRQYERNIGEAIESLRMIKMYRTPQALRSFGRLFTVLLPPLYAASFAQIAFDLQSLTMGIIFAIITPLCLTALFESMTNLEDPFVGWATLDGIDCVEELEVMYKQQLENTRNEAFPKAEAFEIRKSVDISQGQDDNDWC